MTSDALRHQIIKLQRNNSLQNVVCVCVCVGLFFYCLTVRTQSHSCIWKKLCFFFPVLASAPEVLGTHPFESRVERLDALIVIFFCEYPQKPISYQRSRLSPFTSRNRDLSSADGLQRLANCARAPDQGHTFCGLFKHIRCDVHVFI